MNSHIFTRRDGSKLELTLSIDEGKLAEDMARAIIQRGGTSMKATKCGGAVVATMKELSR